MGDGEGGREKLFDFDQAERGLVQCRGLVCQRSSRAARERNHYVGVVLTRVSTEV
jgi:hypothetical protein